MLDSQKELAYLAMFLYTHKLTPLLLSSALKIKIDSLYKPFIWLESPLNFKARAI